MYEILAPWGAGPWVSYWWDTDWGRLSGKQSVVLSDFQNVCSWRPRNPTPRYAPQEDKDVPHTIVCSSWKEETTHFFFMQYKIVYLPQSEYYNLNVIAMYFETVFQGFRTIY